MAQSILLRLLFLLGRATVQRCRPVVVGVTGSVGKTSTKEAIFAVLRERYRVRRSAESYNTEIGMPLAILGARHAHRNPFGWLAVLLRGLVHIVWPSGYPEVLVLEYGVQKPGDMDYLLQMASPLVAVVTAIGEIPVHVEYFAGPADVAAEKAKLVAALPTVGYAVLNGDDDTVAAFRERTRAHPMTYGFGAEAMVRVSDYGISETGTRVAFVHGDERQQAFLKNTFGKQQAYAAAAAIAAGLVLNMSFADAVRALAAYEAPPGRLKLLRGNKDSRILDDTYNAAPAAMHAALDVLAEFPAGRKIAVLGDMLELGRFTEAAHRAVGDQVSRTADVFIAVGERMQFAVAEVRTRWGGDSHRLFWCARAADAGRKLEEILKPGDTALVKGSQGMRMERVVEEVMAEPVRASDLLVRQSVDWKRRPIG